MDYVLDSIDRSKNEFEELTSENPESEEFTFLQAGVAATWLKTEEYYDKVDDSTAYYTAGVLDLVVK